MNRARAEEATILIDAELWHPFGRRGAPSGQSRPLASPPTEQLEQRVHGAGEIAARWPRGASPAVTILRGQIDQLRARGVGRHSVHMPRVGTFVRSKIKEQVT
jgi:hypothetical protein